MTMNKKPYKRLSPPHPHNYAVLKRKQYCWLEGLGVEPALVGFLFASVKVQLIKVWQNKIYSIVGNLCSFKENQICKFLSHFYHKKWCRHSSTICTKQKKNRKYCTCMFCCNWLLFEHNRQLQFVPSFHHHHHRHHRKHCKYELENFIKFSSTHV